MSTDVTYRRGANLVTVPATIGRTANELADGYGAVHEVLYRDYIVSVSDLVLNSVETQPQRGDLIEEVVGGVTHVYRVQPAEDGECWRWSDPYHRQYRIHAKRDA